MANIELKRGTSLSLGYEHFHDGVPHTLVGATVRFTVKKDLVDSSWDDSTAILRKDVTNGSSQGHADISIVPSDTERLEPGKYHYDIKVQESPDKIYLMDEGRFIIKGSPTNRRS